MKSRLFYKGETMMLYASGQSIQPVLFPHPPTIIIISTVLPLLFYLFMP